MRVRALKSFVSEFIVASEGQEFDCPDALASGWVKVGLVERMPEELEAAVMSGGEHAVTVGKLKPRWSR